jgi:hypothetical protein
MIARWDVDTGRAEHLAWMLFGGARPAAALSADGNLIVATGLNTAGIVFWDLRAPRRQIPLPRGTAFAFAFAFSADGKYLAVGGDARPTAAGLPAREELRGALHVWEVIDGKLARRLAPAGDKDERQVRCAVFTPDGRTLIAGDTDGTVALYEVATGRVRRKYVGHQAAVLALSLSADGRLLASGSQDHTALVWDLAGRSELSPAELATADPEKLWDDLASADVRQAFRAVQTLAAVPKRSLPLLKARLRPAGPLLPPGRLDQLLKDLESPRFATRARAVAELERLGDAVKLVLQKAFAEPSTLEKHRRLEKLLAKLDRAWERVLPPQDLRLLRAVEALELMGGPEARQVLERLGRGAPEAWLTAEARASAQRLARRAGGPAARPAPGAFLPERAFRPLSKDWSARTDYLDYRGEGDPPNAARVVQPKDRDPAFKDYHKEVSYYERGADEKKGKPRRILRYAPGGSLEEEIDNVGDEQFSRTLRRDGSVACYLYWRGGRWLDGYSVSADGKVRRRLDDGNGDLIFYGSKPGNHVQRWYHGGANYLEMRYAKGVCVMVRLNAGDDWLIARRGGEEQLLLSSRKEIWSTGPGGRVAVQSLDQPPRIERSDRPGTGRRETCAARRAAFLLRYDGLLRRYGQTWKGLGVDFVRSAASWPD